MIVCVCNAVTESEIRACVELGCTDLESVREAVGVAGCCGACTDCAREIIDRHYAQVDVASTPGAGTTFSIRFPALTTKG